MTVSYAQHFLLAIWALISGFALGFVYEWFRLLHQMHPRAVVLIFVEDLIFSLVCSVSLMLLFFNLSYGRMRFYAFVLLITGFCLWYFTIGKRFRLLLSAIAEKLGPIRNRLVQTTVVKLSAFRFHRFARRGFIARQAVGRHHLFRPKGIRHV